MLRPSLDEACVKRLGVLAHKSGQKELRKGLGYVRDLARLPTVQQL